ncbi:GPR1/FUN34/YaaH family transporter [Actinomycetospora aeridis]|uniref:GPR1/FUN34/YaaH family transporter n=1 Tax=Actinomycetospora aeridis TaxID=3129231 RepID=A0ABU8N6Y5_9PSEU
MTTIDEQSADAGGAHAAADTAAAEAAAAAGANPALVGVPTFVIGSVALGLYLIGFTGASSTALVGMLPILFMCTGIGQLVATVWAARTGNGAAAAIFGIFTGFWLSFAVLATSLGADWFGPTSTDTAVATGAQETFLLTWLIGVVVLTVASLRLPSVFTVLFVLIDAALLIVLLGTSSGSTGLLFLGGIVVFAFALVGVYMFLDALGQATGGKPMPMGKPIIGG